MAPFSCETMIDLNMVLNRKKTVQPVYIYDHLDIDMRQRSILFAFMEYNDINVHAIR